MELEQQLPFPLNRGYGLLRHLGQTASYKFGRSQAIDNLVEREYFQEMARIEAAQAVMDVGEASPIARGELEVVRKFSELYGARDQANLLEPDLAAPPEPFALRQLDRLMNEEIPASPSDPPSSNTSTQQENRM